MKRRKRNTEQDRKFTCIKSDEEAKELKSKTQRIFLKKKCKLKGKRSSNVKFKHSSNSSAIQTKIALLLCKNKNVSN